MVRRGSVGDVSRMAPGNMKALSVVPGTAGSAEMIEGRATGCRGWHAADQVASRRGLRHGSEIIEGDTASAAGRSGSFLVTSRWVRWWTPSREWLRAGPTRRWRGARPDPEPCDHCAAGEWDMCRNGLTRMRHQAKHGYAQECTDRTEFAVRSSTLGSATRCPSSLLPSSPRSAPRCISCRTAGPPRRP